MPFFSSQNYKRTYYGKIGSNSCLSCGLAVIIIIILPFFLAYSTNNFWMPTQFTFEKPTVELLNKILVLAKQGAKTYTYSNQKPFFYAERKLQSVSIKFETDIDSLDAKPERFRVKLGFIPEKPLSATIIHIFLFFDYQLQTTVKMEMQGFAHVTLESSGPISSGFAIGNLNLVQHTPLSSSSITRTVYNNSIFDQAFTNFYNIRAVLDEYKARNESLEYKYEKFVTTGKSINYTEISVEVNVPKHQKILFSPNLLEYVKYAWVQYFSLLVPVYLLITWFLVFMFRYRLMKVTALEDKALREDMKII